MDNLYNLMKELLKKRGIEVEEKGSGALMFSINNLKFVFQVIEQDPYFFRLSLPGINNDTRAYERLHDEIQRMNRNYKVAKIVMQDNHSLWIIADQFVYSTAQFDSLFDRLIQAMTDMIKGYYLIERENHGTEQ